MKPSANHAEEKLEKLREKIDTIDLQLLQLINQRAATALEIGKTKQLCSQTSDFHSKANPDDLSTQNLVANKQNNSDPVFYRPEREALILKRLQEHNQGPLNHSEIKLIFRHILTACLLLQKPMSIAYLGPEGTYSHEALKQHFGTLGNQRPQATLKEVFESVERKEADYGIVPIENSSTGMINLTLDLLRESSLYLTGEIILPIHHAFLSGAEHRDQIRAIYAHEQSLMQCQNWLAHHFPNAEKIAVKSNAKAAKKASEDHHSAAIASEQAADLYNLEIWNRHIEDYANNQTRFVILGQHPVGRSGNDKTSLLIASSHKPGVLYHLLQAFAQHQVNLSQISSRPSTERQWAYVFYIDIEGHQTDDHIQAAIAELEKQAISVHILGSYPKTALG